MRDLRKSWKECASKHPGLILSMSDYQRLFRVEGPSGDKQFYSFDQHGKGRVSAILVYSTLMALAKGTVEDKIGCMWLRAALTPGQDVSKF